MGEIRDYATSDDFTGLQVTLKKAKLQICESIINYCPYCGGINIKEIGKRGAEEHHISCGDCYGDFAIPCDD